MLLISPSESSGRVLLLQKFKGEEHPLKGEKVGREFSEHIEGNLPYSPELAAQMEAAERVMRDDRGVLRKLAE